MAGGPLKKSPLQLLRGSLDVGSHPSHFFRNVDKDTSYRPRMERGSNYAPFGYPVVALLLEKTKVWLVTRPRLICLSNRLDGHAKLVRAGFLRQVRRPSLSVSFCTDGIGSRIPGFFTCCLLGLESKKRLRLLLMNKCTL
jgi:hypothetical protein